MSERSLYRWLDSKMSSHWESERLENCSNKGIPDTVITPVKITPIPIFIELKDWSNPKNKHPLSIEQKNFLITFGGVVLVKTDDKTFVVVCCNFDALLTCHVDEKFVAGRFNMSAFNPDQLIKVLLDSVGCWD